MIFRISDQRVRSEQPVPIGIFRQSACVPSQGERLMTADPQAADISEGKAALLQMRNRRFRIDDLHLADRNVLMVEDIIDTGRTCDCLMRMLGRRQPRVLKVCTLLDKPSRRIVPVAVDYIGFAVENRFVVGYGLDYDESYRNLRAIYYLDDETPS